jgi:BlaI family penicillinase repressor
MFVRTNSYIENTMEIKPTESELEILQIIWKKGECSVRDVHEELSKNKDAGYTTTLKLMQIMHDKGLVERDTTAKTHLYKAVITREQAQQTALDKIISTVFKGSTADLVIQALGHRRASKDEIEAIKNYLREAENRDLRLEIRDYRD